jgi:hypothetical protein
MYCFELTRFLCSDQLSVLRSLVTVNPTSVNAVDSVGVYYRVLNASYDNLGACRTVVHRCIGPHRQAI